MASAFCSSSQRLVASGPVLQRRSGFPLSSRCAGEWRCFSTVDCGQRSVLETDFGSPCVRIRDSARLSDSLHSGETIGKSIIDRSSYLPLRQSSSHSLDRSSVCDKQYRKLEHCRMSIVEVLKGLFDCNHFCSQTPARGPLNIVSTSPAKLLCSCAVLTPGLASSAVEGLLIMDFVAASFTLAGALGILQFFDELAKRNVLEKKLSRKLVHILSGLVFMLFWPLFSAAPLAKYLAGVAPAANGLRMIGLGLGLWKNESLVKAVSREGSQRELLKGPLYYAITITIATLCFWRTSPVGAVAVANLCAGDGFADILGRKYGSTKLPYNSSKSYVGSVAFLVLASLTSMGYVAFLSAFGFFVATGKTYLATILVSLASTIAESLPLPIDDNFTVPFTAIVVGMLIF